MQHNFDRGCSAQPPPEVLEKDRAYTQVQLGPNIYAVTSLLGCGLPQLFENMAPSRHIVRNRLGLWCILPKTQSVVPESWYASNPVIPETSTVTQPNAAENLALEVFPEAPAEEPAQQAPPEAPVLSCQPPPTKDSAKPTYPIPSTQSTQPNQKEPHPAKDSANPTYPITNLPTYPIPSTQSTQPNQKEPHPAEDSANPTYPITNLPIYPIPSTQSTQPNQKEPPPAKATKKPIPNYGKMGIRLTHQSTIAGADRKRKPQYLVGRVSEADTHLWQFWQFRRLWQAQ